MLSEGKCSYNDAAVVIGILFVVLSLIMELWAYVVVQIIGTKKRHTMILSSPPRDHQEPHHSTDAQAVELRAPARVPESPAADGDASGGDASGTDRANSNTSNSGNLMEGIDSSDSWKWAMRVQGKSFDGYRRGGEKSNGFCQTILSFLVDYFLHVICVMSDFLIFEFGYRQLNVAARPRRYRTE